MNLLSLKRQDRERERMSSFFLRTAISFSAIIFLQLVVLNPAEGRISCCSQVLGLMVMGGR